MNLNFYTGSEYKINILGTDYSILITSSNINDRVKGLRGTVDFTTKEILINNKKPSDNHDMTQYNEVLKKTLRHEIIHAFLYESGLDDNSGIKGIATDTHISPWAINEEMIDWFAIQSPKIFKVLEELTLI